MEHNAKDIDDEMAFLYSEEYQEQQKQRLADDSFCNRVDKITGEKHLESLINRLAACEPEFALGLDVQRRIEDFKQTTPPDNVEAEIVAFFDSLSLSEITAHQRYCEKRQKIIWKGEREITNTAINNISGLPELVTSRELAAMLNISTRTLSRWESLGHAPDRVKVGNTVLFYREAIREWLKKNETRHP